MFYYAEIDGEYLVVNTHGLTQSSTNPNYVPITEEQYTSGDLVGMYYNSLINDFEIVDWDDTMGGSHQVSVYTTNLKLSTQIDNMQAEINSKADANHTHDGYASSDDLQLLTDVVNTKADAAHTHNGYAAANHSHNEYATIVDFNSLGEEVDGKADANHSHTEYAFSAHEHDYAASNHNHDESYAPLSHSHSNYATTTALDQISSTVSGKANISDLNAHANDTEVHITDAERNIWNAKSNFSGNYNDLTNKPTIPSINGLATETYVDTQIDAIDIPNALSDLTTDSTHRVVTDDEKAAWNAKSNFSGSYNDLTNKPTIPSISGLATETYVDEAVSAKANSSHTHTITNISGLQTALNTKSDSTHNHDSSYDVLGAASGALASAQTYTDEAVDALSETVSTKANASALTSHTGNTTVHITGTERTNWNAAKTHADSAHAPANAEPNQNAFSNVVVGNTTISADTKTDTLTFVAGNNITITPDSTGDSITISSANTVYTHPTSAGNKHIPAGGASGQILRWASDGTAVWGNDNNTTYSVATQTSNGLMSDADKTKLDGIAEGANNYTLPSAGTSLGGVKTGGDVTISAGVITVNDDSHNHVISNVDGLQSALDGKAASGHNHDGTYYTETEVDTLLSGKANSSHTHSISNITNLQSALDGKASTSHGTHVSYSTTAPVMDGSASVGTATTVARSDHKHPTDTSRAAQTDLESLETVVSGKANASHTHTIANVTNLQSALDGKAASGHSHSNATTSAAGLMSASDKAKLDGIASGANAYTLPTASSTLGGVKTTSTVTSNSGYTACPIISGVPYYKDTNTTYSLGSFGVTATATELNYVDGVTSNIQTQLNGKASSSHNHSGVYANANHTHTASAVGAVATGDVATVYEVETYLGI